MGILHAPINEGGKGVLNIRDHNEAIKLKWLHGLSAPKSKRPLWTYFARVLSANAAQHSPIVRPEACINSFLQTWAPSQKKLPTHLKRILKAAKKYNLKWDSISIKPEVARLLPVWFHLHRSLERPQQVE